MLGSSKTRTARPASGVSCSKVWAGVILHLRRYFRYRGPAKIKIARLRPVVRGKKLLRCSRQNTRMYAFDIYQGRAAECQQKVKVAATEDEQQSWLALADSWLVTAELRQTEASQLQNA